jgi:hypothetical protein
MGRERRRIGGPNMWVRNAGPREDNKMTEDQEPMLQFFTFKHLPEHLQNTSAAFYSLAHEIVRELPRNPERTVALRKLLEAKDCAIRAALFKQV